MKTQEEIAGKYNLLQQAKSSADVQLWIATIKELIEDLNAQYMNEKGEEAVRAWGVIKGLYMATQLEMIWGASIQSKLVKPDNRIIKP